jgi:PEP-CTERM motif
MKLNKYIFPSIVVLATGLVSVHAQNLNGTLNSGFYGSALSVQTINTGFGNAAGGNDSVGGSELDAAYGKVSGGNLYLFLAGNFENNGNHLNVFLAGGASGQGTLNTSGGTLATMNGSMFSSGFSATFAFDMNDFSGTLYSEEYNLVANTGGYVGSLNNSGTGIYAGSDGGVSSLYLNNNHASTMGTSGAALSGATSGINTTTGLELVVPLSAIGYTGGNIEVLADINGGGDSYLSNQLLPGQPVGTANLGTSTFNNPGFFTVPVPEPTTLALLGLSGLATFVAVRRRN